MEKDDTSAQDVEFQRPDPKKRCKRSNTPRLKAISIERLIHDIRTDQHGSIDDKGHVMAKLMRLLREIHAAVVDSLRSLSTWWAIAFNWSWTSEVENCGGIN